MGDMGDDILKTFLKYGAIIGIIVIAILIILIKIFL